MEDDNSSGQVNGIAKVHSFLYTWMMNRGLVALIVGVAITIVVIAGGISATNGGPDGQAAMFVKSSLVVTLIWPSASALSYVASRRKTEVDVSGFVNIWRRGAAGCIDYLVLLGFIFPFAALLMLMLEYLYTGEFHWAFQRNEIHATDLVMVPLIWGVFTTIFMYFYKFAKASKATVGQYVMGYKIIAQLDTTAPPKYFRRTIDAAFCSGFWPIFLFVNVHKNKGVYVWDKNSNTRAVRVK